MNATPAITVEVQPKRLVVRLHALTARRHREAVASLYNNLPSVRWDDEEEGYSVPLAYRSRLEAWLAAHFDAGAVVWVMAPHESRSA
jgi:hypothetical protein